MPTRNVKQTLSFSILLHIYLLILLFVIQYDYLSGSYILPTSYAYVSCMRITNHFSKKAYCRYTCHENLVALLHFLSI